VTGQIDIASQLPTITESVTITGPGADQLTIDAGDGADNTFATGDGYRIFDIDDGDNNNEIDVTLSEMTLTGGDALNGIDGDSLLSNAKHSGVIQTAENLTILESTVSGNATGTGGITTSFSWSGDGGDGVFSSSGNLVITDSSISGNVTGAGGDAIGYYGPFIFFYSGGDGGSGGGIASSGSLTITSSLISSRIRCSRSRCEISDCQSVFI
jgi:hypothetical protein